MVDFFMARQPIYDRRMQVTGYELLYRRQSSSNTADVYNNDLATAQVILNTFTGPGLEQIVGNRLAYINLTDNFIMGRYPIPFSNSQVVLEIPETMAVNRDTVDAVRALRNRGYKIALDDVSSLNILPLLDVADVVKVDLVEVGDRIKLASLVKYLRQYPVRLLAEKVETQKELEFCQFLGFDYFQGFFLCRPSTTRGSMLQPNRMVIIHLMGKLYQPDADYNELEEIVSLDVSLSYKLLRLVNSAYYSIPSRINSIRQAMTMIGMEQLKGWLTLFLLSERVEKPEELKITAMIRAKMCESLAREAGYQHPSTFFMAGLLSVLDALMDVPLQQILDQIPISNEVRDALLSGKGVLGECLRCVQYYEQADWDKVHFLRLSTNQIREIYVRTVIWAENFKSYMGI